MRSRTIRRVCANSSLHLRDDALEGEQQQCCNMYAVGRSGRRPAQHRTHRSVAWEQVIARAHRACCRGRVWWVALRTPAHMHGQESQLPASIQRCAAGQRCRACRCGGASSGCSSTSSGGGPWTCAPRPLHCSQAATKCCGCARSRMLPSKTTSLLSVRASRRRTSYAGSCSDMLRRRDGSTAGAPHSR